MTNGTVARARATFGRDSPRAHPKVRASRVTALAENGAAQGEGPRPAVRRDRRAWMPTTIAAVAMAAMTWIVMALAPAACRSAEADR
jgi:hypothetical protein